MWVLTLIPVVSLFSLLHREQLCALASHGPHSWFGVYAYSSSPEETSRIIHALQCSFTSLVSYPCITFGCFVLVFSSLFSPPFFTRLFIRLNSLWAQIVGPNSEYIIGCFPRIIPPPTPLPIHIPRFFLGICCFLHRGKQCSIAIKRADPGVRLPGSIPPLFSSMDFGKLLNFSVLHQ